MGKRKERRLAAKTAANRRVKLDLLAEPSGDFGDSPNKGEVGDGDSAKNHAGSPISPSSSGQRPENPLLLLGQYSDEELEEESAKETSRDTAENSPAAHDEQVKVDGHEGTGGDKDENLIADEVDQENKGHPSSLAALTKLEENGVVEDNTAMSLHRDTNIVGQASVPWTSDTQTAGDIDSGWKMVLHEESNSYYYWNVVTGETSWEVPVVLAQGNESTHDPKSDLEVERNVNSVDSHMLNENLDAEMDATKPNNGSTNTVASESREVDGSTPELEPHDEKYTGAVANDKDEGDHDTIDGRKMSIPDGVVANDVETHSMDPSIQDDHANQGILGDHSSDSLRLLQLGETLSDRLKSFKGSEGFTDQISKLMFELDIRLADIKSLVPYGSSLLPFWLHSEDQLKKLEASVNSLLKRSQLSNMHETNESENKLEDNVCETTGNEANAASTSLEFDASDHGKDTKKVLTGASGIHPENVTPTGYSNLFVDSAPREETVDLHENANSSDVLPNADAHSSEDVDMDVEMEVEDAVLFGNAPVGDDSGIHSRPQMDQSVPPPIPHHESHGSGECDVPPPPNDDWIPPPPLDEEPVPPPPPDEPHDAQFPPLPSGMQTAQPYSYGEQYSLTYPGSSFEYYGQTNPVQSNDYYVDANGCQVAAPLTTLYYAPVANPYPDAASIVNPGEPVTYYTLQDGLVPTAPAISTVETSALHKSLDQTESIATWNDRPLSSSKVEVSVFDGEIRKPSTGVSSISVANYAPATSTVTRDVPVGSATTAPLAEPVSKVQPKVSRNKKRSVSTVSTLRSNKKVSGLVDKWKAVKEELHDDEEDEPENACEVLEKKRQREIEQWIAQQIATGEAKDNANFQPLGGDWRERVRRKRAKKSIEAEENAAKAVSQQPDLVELSKQLPSGWQAYWDEASKQVYYGNSKTSETTWIKPTI